MNSHRGVVQDPEILAKAKTFFGEDFGNRREPRLMAYLDFRIKNGGRFSPRDRRLDVYERVLLHEWDRQGWIRVDEVEGTVVVLSKEFFMIMSEILWDAYVEKDQ